LVYNYWQSTTQGEKMKNDIFLYYELIKDLFLGKLDEWFIV
jgi:hypothetical protein